MPRLIDKFVGQKSMLIGPEQYEQMYDHSIHHPRDFWADQAKAYLHWEKPWEHVIQGELCQANVRWFVGGALNACYNCLDRHLADKAQRIALIWEGDEASQTRQFTYQILYEHVCRFANGLLALGVRENDCVCIYLPTIPEAVIAMLACARIGAIHSVVFAGFSAEALKQRIEDAHCSVLITSDIIARGGKQVNLLANVRSIVPDCSSIEHVVVVNNGWAKRRLLDKEIWYHQLVEKMSVDCPAVLRNATDPLFILYTSGSTGKPKGIVHGIGGYLLHVAMSFRLIFNYQVGDVFWCTADVGWITGHSYMVYGPLANGATVLLFSGTPTYPSIARYWEVIQRHKVNIFYTAPTIIRTFMRYSDKPVWSNRLDSLRLLGSVGEPINPEAWLWLYQVVGKQRCPIVDTWWQTETGGIMISPLPGAMPLKPGAAGAPFFGIKPEIVDSTGLPMGGKATGDLVIAKPWPGMALSIYGDHPRFLATYFEQVPDFYLTGDGAYRDGDGYFHIAGRTDDVLNVSGHRLDSAEIEGAIASHTDVAEAAVVGYPDEIKGEGIYAFVTTPVDVQPDEALKMAVQQAVRYRIGSLAVPDIIQWATDLPKTRSGKIMRRLLRLIAQDRANEMGDVSTLANPDVMKSLIANRVSVSRAKQEGQ